MRNIIFSFLVMMVPFSAAAFPVVNTDDCSGMVWVENVEELKQLVLKEGDYQVFKHEYVPHYKLGDFHIYLKGDAVILYNRYDKNRKEYTISNMCRETEGLVTSEYSELIQKQIEKNLVVKND